jgi:PPK2 family polyphosphate:nucleotide phosphotransferase
MLSQSESGRRHGSSNPRVARSPSISTIFRSSIFHGLASSRVASWLSAETLRTRNLRLHGHKRFGRLETPALDSAKGGYAMARQEVLDRIQKYVHPFRVTKGKGFQLKDFDPVDTRGLKMDKPDAAELLRRGTEWLAEEQDMLYAQNRWSLLLVFQAMDAAGKDGTIKHVMSGVNPQGCQVVSFKQPSSEDLDHDFMWRYSRRLPERGRIGVFNRSYYEEVLVVRVHDEILKRQQLPPPLVSKGIWDERLADIAHFEDYLTRQGTIVLKFFLNVSREEQKRRFMQRLERPEKNWKFSASDVHERKFWGDYMHAFEEAIRATASKQAPWYVVPADNKWFTRLVVAAAVVEAVEELNLTYPKVDAEKKKELVAARAELAGQTS